jgi:hypothetical protein
MAGQSWPTSYRIDAAYVRQGLDRSRNDFKETNMATSSFRIDSFDASELDEAIWNGEVCGCDVTDHYDWAENIHGYLGLARLDEWMSACDDCFEEDLADYLLDEALAAGLDAAEITRRIAFQLAREEYEQDLADALRIALAKREAA